MLTKQQKKELFSELQIEREKKFADRIRIILLLDQRESTNQIAKFLFLNETTIRNYKNRYQEGGIEKLLNDHYVGRSCFLSEKQQIFFGRSLSLSGDGNILAVGDPHEDSSTQNMWGNQANDEAKDSGAAYLYHSIEQDFD